MHLGGGRTSIRTRPTLLAIVGVVLVTMVLWPWRGSGSHLQNPLADVQDLDLNPKIALMPAHTFYAQSSSDVGAGAAPGGQESRFVKDAVKLTAATTWSDDVKLRSAGSPSADLEPQWAADHVPLPVNRAEGHPVPWLMRHVQGELMDLPSRPLNFWEIQSKQVVPSWVDRDLFRRISVGQGFKSSRLVAVTSCCNLFPLTRRVLINLALLRDVVDVVVIDDASEDDTLQRLAEWDIRVLSANPEHHRKNEAVGLSRSWNTAWRYFKANPRWKTLYLLNNDIMMDHHTFDYMDMALLDPQFAETPIVVGPMTTKRGLGEMSATYLPQQDIEEGIFGPHQEKVPRALLDELPHSMGMLNIWLQRRVSPTTHSPPVLSSGPWLLGFLLGFKRHPSVEHQDDEIVPNTLVNIGQEENLFQRAEAVAVRNVFVFHDKGTTMANLGSRNDMEHMHSKTDVLIFNTEVCEDFYPTYKCKEFAEEGYCTSRQSLQGTIWLRCRKTCGLCPFNEESADCVDRNATDCRWRASTKQCESNPAYMIDHCRKSCAMCPAVHTGRCWDVQGVDCPARAMRGECESNSQEMEKTCRMSCGKCAHVLGMREQCTDVHDNCKVWAKKEWCVSSPYWVRQQCRKSCAICEKPAVLDHFNGHQCGDRFARCAFFRATGECDSKDAQQRQWVNDNCAFSCGRCQVNQLESD